MDSGKQQPPPPRPTTYPPAAHLDALRGLVPSREELLREARAQTERQHARRKAAARAALPAVLVALVAGAWWADPVLRTETLQTAIGQQARWEMHDGSRIQLDTASTVQVEIRLASRRFVLEAGAAAFVAAHGWRSFVVEAGDTRVRDIGTAFDVRREGAGAQVIVTEGAVEVTRGRTALVLHAGQFVRPDALEAGQGRVPQEATAWQQGRMAFDGTPLADAVRQIQRYRSAPVTLADDPALAALRLSGDYDVQGVEALIDALPQALPVRVRRAADGAVHIGARRRVAGEGKDM